MQLTKAYLITILMSGLLFSAVAACSQIDGIELKWKPNPDKDVLLTEEFIIDASLPSGVQLKGIRYGKEKLTKKWTVGFGNMVATSINSNNGEVNSLSEKDFKDLFGKLISFIKKNNDGQLDRVHIGLGLITELWEDTASFLRQGVVPSNYKLKPKDLNLAKKISSHLKDSSILKMLCDEAKPIHKVCKNNFVSMNPITFELDYIGKEWNQVEKLPNTGIPTDKLWFGLSLSNIFEQSE